MLDSELKLRRLLWFHHGCPISALYGDDGEMQCNHPTHKIDFLRDPVELIEYKLLSPAGKEIWDGFMLYKKLKESLNG